MPLQEADEATHKVIVVIPLSTGEVALDGTWVHVESDGVDSSTVQTMQAIAASQLMGLRKPVRKQLIDTTLFQYSAKGLEYKEDQSVLLNRDMLNQVQRLGFTPEEDLVMSYKLAHKSDFGRVILEKYQTPNPEVVDNDIDIARDMLMQITGRGSGVILSFDKLDVKRSENESSVIIMPKDFVYMLNGTRESTMPTSSGSDKEMLVIKRKALHAFKEGLNAAEILHVIDIQ